MVRLAESERPPSDEASAASTSSVDRIFGMKTVQRTQCLTGAPDERLRHSRTFQVCCTMGHWHILICMQQTGRIRRPPTASQVELQYPPASERSAHTSATSASGLFGCQTRRRGERTLVGAFIL